MICSLLLGREGSTGFPGKNTTLIGGRPLVSYPLLASLRCAQVDQTYLSTDSEKLKEIGRSLGVRLIDRPAHLATQTALGEDAFVHGYQRIQNEIAREGKSLELLVLLFANAAMITPELISQGIGVLRQHPDIDSAVSVSRYNMWSPLRARRIGEDGLLHPFVPFETFGDPKTLNCDRDSQGDVWFADMGASVVRPRCLEHIEKGLLPQKWMGQKIWPLKQWGGLDVDYDWQIPAVEYWLKTNGLIPKSSAGEERKANP
jgi:hypothetical protein